MWFYFLVDGFASHLQWCLLLDDGFFFNSSLHWQFCKHSCCRQFSSSSSHNLSVSLSLLWLRKTPLMEPVLQKRRVIAWKQWTYKLVSRLPDSSGAGIRNETGSHMVLIKEPSSVLFFLIFNWFMVDG
ncbi:hypothetical protein JHK82_012598 [Glycine max]|nr:hypothetical protein JHK85_012949 [Glycine max]KAG5057617.1 hypothetical protein JHK86_012613 [Glycine max]KAG5154629.1 hypothetical protein JHK82_012598 [Glycine max]